MKSKCALLALLSATLWLLSDAACAERKMPAELRMPGIFSDNMVLQRDQPVPIWGWADVGAEITVEFAGQKKTAKAEKEADSPSQGPGHPASPKASTRGRWMVKLDPMKASCEPRTLTITSSIGDLKSQISNVLVGDVWLCSGQSNMEMPVGYTTWGGGALNYEEEIKNSANPLLRQFEVEHRLKSYRQEYGNGTWRTAGPADTDQFSATGYFFAREIQRNIKIPVAILTAAKGATAIELWISREAMTADPEFRRKVDEQVEDATAGAARRHKAWVEEFTQWQKKYGRTDDEPSKSILWATGDTAGWKTVTLPGRYVREGCKNGGIMWLRREVEIPAGYERASIVLPAISALFTVFVNGNPCGASSLANGYGQRIYVFPLPQGTAPGKNVIAFRIHTFAGNGGINGKSESFRLIKSVQLIREEGGVPLSGEWLCKPEVEYEPLPRDAERLPVMAPGLGWNFRYAGLQFGSIVKPVVPFAIKGVVWYQGEHNCSRAYEYGKLLKMLIGDWRQRWGSGDVPFYICQLPNHGQRPESPEESGWAELREAQAVALELPNTGLANLIDTCEDGDLHPRNKQEVGRRLALLALANTYGDKTVACYGPMYESMSIKDGKAVIKFKHAADGLVAKRLPATYRTDLKKPDSEVKPLALPSPNSEVQGFAIYGAAALAEGGTSNQWVWADAKIVSDSTVEVWSDKVAKPLEVRYAWADHPVCNLYNKAGLPAFPFRTDKTGQ